MDAVDRLLIVIIEQERFVGDENSENWFLKNKINLGLDLQGGSYLLLEVQLDVLYKEELDNFVDSVRLISRDQAVKIEKIDIVRILKIIPKLLSSFSLGAVRSICATFALNFDIFKTLVLFI